MEEKATEKRKDYPDDFKIRTLESNPDDLYLRQGILGEGSYGRVYKAIGKKDGKVYAAKVIDLEEDLCDVEKEIWFLQTCDHVNIIKGYDSFFHDSKLWIILECCEGGSLYDLIDVVGRNLNEEELSVVILHSLEGLKYLHDMRRIHRDIKAGNILVSQNGVVKITDFGVSAQLSDNVLKRLTLIGTAYWMAPEVVLSKEYDEKSDIWSLGITMLELSQGKAPLSGINPVRAFFLIPKRPPPKFRNPEDWSTECQDFLSRCLVKNPDERPSCDDLISHPWIVKCREKYKKPGSSEMILKKLVDQMFQIFDEKGGREGYYRWKAEQAQEKFDKKKKEKKKNSDSATTTTTSEFEDDDDDNDESTIRKKKTSRDDKVSSEDYNMTTDTEDDTEDETLVKLIQSLGRNPGKGMEEEEEEEDEGEDDEDVILSCSPSPTNSKKDLVSFHISKLREKRREKDENLKKKKVEEKRVMNMKLFNIYYNLSEQEFKLEEADSVLSKKLEALVRIKRTKN